MDVLNTTGGGLNLVFIAFTIGLGLVALVLIINAIIPSTSSDDEFGLFCGGILFGLLSLICFLIAKEPIRHEVTLRPGYVIDATKYEIVEQRGKIYVIEEREANE